MQYHNYFFLIFTATIVLIRVLLSPERGHSPTIGGFRLHHYMYGIVLVVLSFIFGSQILYAVGLALFMDEFAQLVTGKIRQGWKVYYSPKMMLDLLFIIILVYIFRNTIALLGP